ncbi:MAG: (4Fe-4S)-binding protein [Acidimicrobiia bacterium]
MQHEFKNDRIMVSFDDEVCVQAGNCVRTLPAVFHVLQEEPRVDVDAADVEAIEQAVEECPSGALDCEIYE